MVHSQELAAWINAGRRERLLGHGIFCRVQAAPGKDPLLLIHGYPTASYDWHLLWDALAERYSLYALDMLGFGLSDKPRDFDYPITLQADLCVALLAQHGVTRPHVLAHDYGDTVAQELLAREIAGTLPLASMCFLNGGLFPETHRARPIQKLLANKWTGPIRRACDHATARSSARCAASPASIHLPRRNCTISGRCRCGTTAVGRSLASSTTWSSAGSNGRAGWVRS